MKVCLEPVLKVRANRWRCVRCGHVYAAAIDELPPEYCTARQTWALCGGNEFYKAGEETSEAPATDCGVAAQASPILGAAGPAKP
jgi:predicted  nucleic acid-binding Zn-ribbon protein